MPQTLFIFIEDTELSPPFASLLLDEKEGIIESYEKREIESLKKIQHHARIHVVLPATLAKPYIVQLPTLKKAALTVPNLLEDDLIQDTDELHFALDAKQTINHHYLATVIDKNLLANILEKLNALALAPDIISHDFIWTPEPTLFLTERYALLNEVDKAAVFAPDIVSFYQHHPDTRVMTFSNTHPSLAKTIHYPAEDKHTDTYQTYFAKECMNSSVCNLLQGAFQKKTSHLSRFPLISYGIALTALLLFFGAHITQYATYKQELNGITHQNQTLYKVFFPNSQGMVSPRFRIEQLLKSQHDNASDHRFFDLLHALNQTAASHTDIQFEQIQFEDGGLELDITAKTFDRLETFKTAFKQHPVNIKQLSAKTQRKVVKARWRIHL